MRLRTEAKVGLVVILSLLALVGIFLFLSGVGFRAGTYDICAVFNDVLKLSKGAEVRMAGVRIGTVEDITLTDDRKALVEMRISRRFENAIPEDSSVRVTTGSVVGVGDYYVEIIPGSSKEIIKPGECLKSTQLPRLEDLVVDVQSLVNGLQTSVRSVNDILEDPEMRRSLENTLRNAELASATTAALAEDVRSLVSANQPEIERTLANVNAASENFAAVTREIRVAVEQGGIEDVRAALASAGRAAENLEAASLKLRELAEDEAISEDIRQTITSAREAAEGAADIVERVGGILGGRGSDRQPSPAAAGPVPGIGSRFDTFAITDGDWRVDYNYTFPGRGNRFYRAGLVDIGESTGLNLQLGEILNRNSALRYGLYDSRLGIGYDRLLNDNLALQLDLYRPNDLRLETKLRYDFSPEFGAWVGVEDLFGDGDAMLGIQYRK